MTRVKLLGRLPEQESNLYSSSVCWARSALLGKSLLRAFPIPEANRIVFVSGSLVLSCWQQIALVHLFFGVTYAPSRVPQILGNLVCL